MENGTRAVDRTDIDTADFLLGGRNVGGVRTGPNPIPIDKLAQVIAASPTMSAIMGASAIDAAGSFAARSDHSGEAVGFVYVSLDGDGDEITDPVMFVKTATGWSGPVTLDGFSAAVVAQSAADDATAAATAAESARDAAMGSAAVYDDTTSGLAATSEGDQFSVVVGDQIVRYSHDSGGVATEVARYPSAARVKDIGDIAEAVDDRIPAGAPDGYALAFRGGAFLLGGFKDSGAFSVAELEIGTARVTEDTPEDLLWSLRDGSGFAAIGVDSDGNFRVRSLDGVARINGLPISAITSGDFSQSEIALIDQSAAATSTSERNAASIGIQRLTADIIHVVMVGQSFAAASRSWPIMTTTALPGTLMLGQSEHRGTGGDVGDFVVMGGVAEFQPLVGTLVQGTVLLDNDDALEFDPSVSAVRGESPALTAVRHLRRRLVSALQMDLSSTDRQIVLTNCASAGASIEELSKGATTNIYGRIASSVAQVKAAAATAGKSYCLAAICVEQGQSNYLEQEYSGGTATNDLATFRSLYDTYRNDILADSVTGAAGQKLPPAFFVVSPAGVYMRDAGNLGIANAFLSFARETPGVYVVGSDYHVTDRANHLDANGSRWLGTLMGEAMAQVLVDGRSWGALAPIYKDGEPQAYLRGSTIVLPLSVPAPASAMPP